jgi:DNA modification methylase
MSVTIRHGDCREVLRTLPDNSVHCCVTSPPYWGLRDYGIESQIGREDSPDLFVAEMVAVFREVRRVLREDGTLWLNLGDTYQNGKGKSGGVDPKQPARRHGLRPNDVSIPGLKPKDLIGVPWLAAFALRADGWYLRQDIIWSKPNPMPESVQDRCTKAHEYIFLLSKSAKYYYDADSVSEPNAEPKGSGGWQSAIRQGDPDRYQGKYKPNKTEGAAGGSKMLRGEHVHTGGRNKRSVWTVTTQPFSEAHFATFPPDLIEPCIKAGCPAGGVVLDPFGGAGTTGLVADRLGRDAILIELNPEYAAMAERRIRGDAGMFAETTLALSSHHGASHD